MISRETDPDGRSLRGVIGAADVAVHENQFDVAEDALLEALSQVRKQKAGDGSD